MRSIFGWSLPPGCGRLPGEEPEPPCECCGEAVDNCICPECPICGAAGDKNCYAIHGLQFSVSQLVGLKLLEARIEQEREQDRRTAEALEAMIHEYEKEVS